MLFGDPANFAIEIGAVEPHPGFAKVYVQFRFWIGGVAVGDWEDRIPLVASIRHFFKKLCDNAQTRREESFEDVPAEVVLERVYDGFFSYDYLKQPLPKLTLRDLFHMDGSGMGAVEDKYGIVLVGSSLERDRIIVNDLMRGQTIIDYEVPCGLVETVGYVYFEWGNAQIERTLTEDENR